MHLCITLSPNCFPLTSTTSFCLRQYYNVCNMFHMYPIPTAFTILAWHKYFFSMQMLGVFWTRVVWHLYICRYPVHLLRAIPSVHLIEWNSQLYISLSTFSCPVCISISTFSSTAICSIHGTNGIETQLKLCRHFVSNDRMVLPIYSHYIYYFNIDTQNGKFQSLSKYTNTARTVEYVFTSRDSRQS